MKSLDKEILKDQRLLTRFILKLRFLPDTPTLIQFIAGDEDYLLLCSRIVNDSNDHSRELQPLKDICRKQEFDFHVLKEKLTPVAQALGLVEEESDYFELLGVSRDADAEEIKKAFRKKVIEVHPDTGNKISQNVQDFINLQTAYQILSDPLLRQQYEEKLNDVNLWKEKANHTQRLPGFRRLNQLLSPESNPIQSAKTKIYYQLVGLFLILIIIAFIFDFLYRQSSIFDTDYAAKQQKQTQVQKPMSVSIETASERKTANNISEVKSLPGHHDNTHKTFKPESTDYTDFRRLKTQVK